MIIFLSFCILFIASFLALIAITIIIEKSNNFKKRTYCILGRISEWLVRIIILSFFGIGISSCIILLKWVVEMRLAW